MLSTLTAASILAASASLASASPNKRQDTLQFEPCTTGSALECVLFPVPLDYANPSAGTTEIAVIRYLATTTPRKGAMFMNPGGPGVSGVEWLEAGGPSFQAQIGTDWDVYSFDPRGVGFSGPKLNQFQTRTEEIDFWSSVMGPGQFESHGNLTTAKDVDFFMSTASAMDDRLTKLNELFVKRNGDNLKYVGSAAVVRDVAALFDAIEGPDSEINFYGYSYGTLLAMYITQMFPERVGKVLIDGVVDPSDWAQYEPYLGWDLDIADTEAVWKGFTQACAEGGPDFCALAESSSTTAEEIEQTVEKILSRAYNSWTDINNYSQNEITESIFGYLYSPSGWTELSVFLADFLSTSVARKSPTPRRPLSILHGHPMMRSKPLEKRSSPSLAKNFFTRRAQGYAPIPTGNDTTPLSPTDRGAYLMNDYAIVAIFCGDSADPIGATTEDVFQEIVRVSQTVSHKFGQNFNSRFFCHKWTARAAERYKGPWNKQTKNTVLVIGNEADPITPYRSAELIASKDYLGTSARLIKQWNFGHTSGAMNSDCTSKAIADYMSGTVPSDKGNDNEDLVCSTEQAILGNDVDKHWEPVTSQNGDSLTSGPNDPGLANLGKDIINDDTGLVGEDNGGGNNNNNGNGNGSSWAGRRAEVSAAVAVVGGVLALLTGAF